MESNNLEKAIECFKDAEKLDQLNKDIYLKKGMCYLQMVNTNFIKNFRIK